LAATNWGKIGLKLLVTEELMLIIVMFSVTSEIIFFDGIFNHIAKESFSFRCQVSPRTLAGVFKISETRSFSSSPKPATS